MRKASTPYLFLKDDTYYFRRIIPKKCRVDFNGKSEWIHSLGKLLPHEALVKVAEWTKHYSDLLKGLITSADHTVQALKERGASLGLKYRYVDVVAAAEIEEAIEMVGPGLELLSDLADPDPQLIATIGGTAEPPAMTMRQAWEEFAKHMDHE